MDLEIREALALAVDRDAALDQLLPGSEDHDYHRCLRAQHAGALDEAQAILDAWIERHGPTARYERLSARQEVHRVLVDPVAGADAVRDRFGANLEHEAEVEDAEATRARRLADDVFSGEQLLAHAVARDGSLSEVSDEGLLELIARPLDPARRRALLTRLAHSPQPELVAQVAEDLAQRNHPGFGALAVHGQLTAAQLAELAERRPELRASGAWVAACVRRMRPHHAVDLELDLAARAAYLEALWAFVAALPPANATLAAHVLWHLLDTTRRRGGAVDVPRLAAYLQLPRPAVYAARPWRDRLRREDLAELGADLRATTGLGPAGSDEDLVRALLEQLVVAGADLAPLTAWLDADWLAAELATLALLHGAADADRATLVLGPAAAAALRERVELAWCAHNPLVFAADAPVALDADSKRIDELHVKVFRIDPRAYFQLHHKELGTDVDLDGIAASHELVIRATEPAVRRVRRRIELPMCERPGSYVIDLIGGGIASRALIHKGRLRHAVRHGAAGHVITVLDEAGAPQPDARVWLGDREYAADAQGAVVIPFSTSPARVPMLLACGDLATVAQLSLVRETYALAVELVLDRASLAAGATARAIARVRLTVAGAPASLALLDQPTWEVALTDRHGVTTTRSQPLSLAEEDDAAVLEWPLGPETADLAITVRGEVEVRSEQRREPLVARHAASLALILRGDDIEALYLARTAAGWVVSALGLTGEPLAQRPIALVLTHRWARTWCTAELATDAAGRVELGALPGVEWITATLGDLTQRWPVGEPGLGATLHAAAGREVIVPLPPGRSAAEVARRMSLVEIRGGAPARHASEAEVELLEGALVVRGLAAGDYELRAPGVHAAIVVAPGPERAGCAIAAGEVVEVPRALPVIAALDAADGGATLRIAVHGATRRTRVHVVATRFLGAPVAALAIGPARVPGRRADRGRAAGYVSGRELGDEYRYILDRRTAPKFPGLLLARPGVLLDPWARRATATATAEARVGGAFRAAPAMMAQGSAYAADMVAGGAAAADEAYPSYDFLPAPPAVLANLVPADGVVAIPRAALGDASDVAIIVDDPAGLTLRRAALPETALAARDLRLALALDPARPAAQRKAITALTAGAQLAVEDLATAQIQVLDSVERAHGYLLALRDDPALRELGFVTRWHQLPDAERRALYSKYACHELRLFLFAKDRAFFDDVIRPYLANKRVKTFLDHWLLGDDLARYLEPARFGALLPVELALLAHRLPDDDAIPRLLADRVAAAPPDPATDARIIDALLGGALLDGDAELAEHQASAREEELSRVAFGAGGGGAPTMPKMAMRAMAAPPAPSSPRGGAVAKKRKAELAKEPAADRDDDDAYAESESAAYDDRDSEGDHLRADVAARQQTTAHYRAVGRTEEWAESNWYRCERNAPPMFVALRLWRDVARQPAGAPRLSPWLGLATGSFAEAMCALALTDLPFVAPAHAWQPAGPRLTLTAGGNALVATSQIVDRPVVSDGPPVVVGASYVRADDRDDWSTGEQVPKHLAADAVLATGVVYTCQVVLANPTSARQRVAALLQIPRGSLPVDGARTTHALEVSLEPYGTHGHEYSFYFPAPGRWSHYPVHVSRGDAIVAIAPARELVVATGGGGADPASWAHVSQRGTLAEVVAFLARANLAAPELELDRVAWRLSDPAAYAAILDALERRRAYHPALWAYALLHADLPRLRAWLRTTIAQGGADLGPALAVLDLDAEDTGAYEHLEYAPLINARAHRLGPALRILNDGLAAQYERFLDLVAHRPAATADDLLAGAAYLLAQDRVPPALALLARVEVAAIADRLQHAYLAAYAACLTGDLDAARALAAPWREHPVDRWRQRFAALLAMLDEVARPDTAPAVLDPRSREQQLADHAASAPAFELSVDRDGIELRSHHVRALELRFFAMDIELLFSRQPFVHSDSSRFAFVEPGHRELLGDLPPTVRVPWPAALRGKNVVVEAVAAGQRKGAVHYANDLAPRLAQPLGQLRVTRATDGAALPATYVKVYARMRGGSVAFYKDGYTDLRGWFDYASLSTADLDRVERFAILIAADDAGAAILEAAPPVR